MIRSEFDPIKKQQVYTAWLAGVQYGGKYSTLAEAKSAEIKAAREYNAEENPLYQWIKSQIDDELFFYL